MILKSTDSGGLYDVYKLQKTIPLFGRFAVPLLVWLIIGPIAALVSWLLLRKRTNQDKPSASIRLNLPRSPDNRSSQAVAALDQLL